MPVEVTIYSSAAPPKKTKSPPVEVTVTFSIPDDVAKLMPQCSIERVINTTLDILSTSSHEDATVNEDDWRDFKAPIISLYGAVNNALICKVCGYELTVGIPSNPYPVSKIGQY